ncbi:MAG TPA: ABC transporter substrate-binding protein [Stellaceae bacterium]|jgi:putative ABC transport system substrate-binding protein
MRLRWFAALLLVAAGPGVAAAGPVKIGLMTPGSMPQVEGFAKGIAAQLAQRGLVRDRDFAFDLRAGGGKVAALRGLAKELVANHDAVIVTSSYPAARAVAEATSTIPIVSMYAGEPDETGLAETLTHPGGNVTGLSDLSADLSAKRLQLLKEAVPGVKRVAMLYNADDAGMVTRYRAAQKVAPALGVTIESLGVREPDDFGTAFDAMTRTPPDGILMVTDVLTILNRKRVFDFAAAHKVPAIYEADMFAREGGLMSYGPDGKEVFERVAGLIAQILKGAKPADLPIEQPTRFSFVINQKTADAMGLKFPPDLLARADDVIE